MPSTCRRRPRRRTSKPRCPGDGSDRHGPARAAPPPPAPVLPPVPVPSVRARPAPSVSDSRGDLPSATTPAVPRVPSVTVASVSDASVTAPAGSSAARRRPPRSVPLARPGNSTGRSRLGVAAEHRRRLVSRAGAPRRSPSRNGGCRRARRRRRGVTSCRRPSDDPRLRLRRRWRRLAPRTGSSAPSGASSRASMPWPPVQRHVLSCVLASARGAPLSRDGGRCAGSISASPGGSGSSARALVASMRSRRRARCGHGPAPLVRGSARSHASRRAGRSRPAAPAGPPATGLRRRRRQRSGGAEEGGGWRLRRAAAAARRAAAIRRC